SFPTRRSSDLIRLATGRGSASSIVAGVGDAPEVVNRDRRGLPEERVLERIVQAGARERVVGDEAGVRGIRHRGESRDGAQGTEPERTGKRHSRPPTPAETA